MAITGANLGFEQKLCGLIDDAMDTIERDNSTRAFCPRIMPGLHWTSKGLGN